MTHHSGDSAGFPWAGREFARNVNADDDGSAPAGVRDVLERFRADRATGTEVVKVLRDSRVLVPLVAVAGDEGRTAEGLRVDKTQELSLVTVAGPDGRTVQPVFTSVAAMARWDSSARPVPTPLSSVALAAASEGTDLVIVDPTSETEFVIRRPALWAIAQSAPWIPSYDDPAVLAEFRDAAATEPAVTAVALSAGDPTARLRGAELVVRLNVVPGLDSTDLSALLARLQDRWARSDLIAARVDSLAVQVAPA